ncbi:MAG TPA: hypothetical protein VGO93_11895, partial [Candidatus Xenobia bacterium]
MLVFVSDFHFSDPSAGTEKIPYEAYEGTLRDIASYACDAKAEHVELVFLGDTFDLIRTTGWFDVSMAERPWGVPPRQATDPEHLAAVERHAHHLLDRLIAHNQKPIDLLATDLAPLGFKQPV